MRKENKCMDTITTIYIMWT